MAHALVHRGPDGSAHQLFSGAGLAHTRLAIIDLSADASQPLPNEDETVWVTFNGEIYNHHELRATLTQHTFRSRTDTEVIVHLYEQGGLEALDALDGMFAFGLWDAPRGTLVLGRDRSGKKPLFVYSDDSQVVFASELKALVACGGLDLELSHNFIASYLMYGYLPSPRTPYRNIRKLLPGCMETFGADPDATDSQRRYWQLPRVSEPVEPEAAARRVRRVVESAVVRRLESDVALGAFLSGGLDSTIVVSVMARELDHVRTFSLGFDGDASYDESEFARSVAREFGTDHTEFRVGPEELQKFPELMESFDEPFADASAIPTAIVSRMAREHVTVALTGDGGDEVFGGYDRFSADLLAQRIPPSVGKLLFKIAKRIPSGSMKSTVDRSKRFLERFDYDRLEGYLRWISIFKTEEILELLGELPADLADPYARALERAADHDGTNQLLSANFENYLLDDLNVKVDRASMACGLETRAPFLDTAVIECGFGLPGALKVRGRDTKWILKKAFRDVVPTSVLKRRKMGFGVPLAAWIRGPLRSFVEDALAPGAPLFAHVEQAPVRALLEDHIAGRIDAGQRVFSLLVLDGWLRRFG